MAKIDLEIIKQVLTLKVPALSQEELANIVGEMRSMSDAITQDDNLAQPVKIKKKVVSLAIDLGDWHRGAATLKVPVTISDDALLYKCLNTAALEYNASRTTNRGKVNNIYEALDLMKNKAFKPYGIQILSRPSDGSMVVDTQFDDQAILTQEEIDQILNPPIEEDTEENEDQQPVTTEITTEQNNITQ